MSNLCYKTVWYIKIFRRCIQLSVCVICIFTVVYQMSILEPMFLFGKSQPSQTHPIRNCAANVKSFVVVLNISSFSPNIFVYVVYTIVCSFSICILPRKYTKQKISVCIAECFSMWFVSSFEPNVEGLAMGSRGLTKF